MNEFIKYIKDALNTDVSVTKIKEEDRSLLPLYLAGIYDLYDATIAGVPVLLAELISETSFAPKQFLIHEQLLEKFRGKLVVFVFHKYESYNRNRLAGKGINFVLIGNRIHIPALWMILEKEKKGHRISSDLTPSAQAVLLCYLYGSSANYSYRELSEKLLMPYTTVCKAIETLLHMKLCTVIGSRDKQVHFEEDKSSFLQQILPLLLSPVKRVVYMDKQPKNAVVAGITALSEYSMINPDEQRSFAISFDDYKKLNGYSLEDMYLPYRVEVWKYAPCLFAQNGCVDKISLYLSLRDNQDERVQYELKQMIQQLW